MTTPSAEVKLPHHFSKEYLHMKAEGLIDENKNYIGGIPLDEYLKSLNLGPEEPNIRPESQSQNQTSEPSIPLSQVQGLVAEMVAAQIKNINAPTPQPFQYAAIPKNDSNIDDIPELRDWVMKDREYELIGDVRPISASIANKHTEQIALQYTNKETQQVHILRYATNQPSFFVEKQSKEPGSVLVAEIIFNYGRLKVPADNVTLQKFLAIHPHKNKTFREYDPLAKSRKVIADKKLKIQANNLVMSVGEVMNRAIASLEFPHYVDSWDKEVLEEEIFAFSDKNPEKYIKYTEDPTVKMKGVIKKSLATGELIYSNYRFLNSKREMILEVPKNKNEMDELVSHFESGMGRTLYEYLLNKI